MKKLGMPMLLNQKYLIAGVIDTNEGFTIIKGHFTAKDNYELFLQRSFTNKRYESSFVIGCLFTLEKDVWKFKQLLDGDSIRFIDINRDSILEVYSSVDYIGNGSIDISIGINSLKDNKWKTRFSRLDTDNKNNPCAFTVSKVGDTIVNVAEYSFVNTVLNQPIDLKEIRKIGIKKGVSSNNEELLIDYSFVERIYKYEEGQYK